MLRNVAVPPEQIVYLYKNDSTLAMQFLEEKVECNDHVSCLLETIPPSGAITVAIFFDRLKRHATHIATMHCTKETPYTAIRQKFGF